MTEHKKKVLVISTSIRGKNNLEIMAKEFVRGEEEAGHEVEFVSLRDKPIGFCKGCLACHATQRCVIQDDAVALAEKVGQAQVIAFATPIYFYEMCGQMKTLLDRCNPLYSSDYQFRDIYLLATAAEDSEAVPAKAISGLQGWIDCFPKAQYCGCAFGGGIDDPGA